MQPELLVLKLLLKKEPYQQYRRFVKIPPDLREIKTLYYALDTLHSKYPENDKSLDDLTAMVYACYPNMKSIEREAIDGLLVSIKTSEVSEDLLIDLVGLLQTRAVAAELALAALEVAEGRRDAGTLSSIYEKITQPSEVSSLNDEETFITDDLFLLESGTICGPGLTFRLACLRRSLGPLRPGDFGFVFARPETGKTTFLADQCSYMAGQTDKPIIWFNNEEQGEKVRLRTYQAALGITQDEIWAHKQENLDKYREITKGNLKIYDEAQIHRSDVERLIARYDPVLVVFDQIDKIKGFSADRPDLVYGRIYQWARELAKGGRAIIGTCQADGTGEGVRWLTMAHVAEAKTSKQAEADWILGIGKSHDAGTDDVRYLNISKNKLLGDTGTDPRERHGRFPVFINPTIARYEDVDG